MKGPEALDALFGEFFDRTTGFFAILSPDGTLLRVNQAVREGTGDPPPGTFGRPLWDTFWFRGLATQQEQVRRVVVEAASGAPAKTELEYRTADGTQRWADASFHPVRDDTHVSRILVEAHDVTERKLAEEALRKSEFELRAIMDAISAFVGVLDTEGRFVRLNRAACDASAVREEEVIGRYAWELPGFQAIEGEVARVREEVTAALEGRESRREVRFRGEGGSIIYADATVKPVYDRDGALFRVVADSRDVTGRVVAERELRRSEARYRALFEQSRDGVFLGTTEGSIIDLNTAAERMFGLRRDDVVGRGLALLLGEASPRLLELIREGREDGSFEVTRNGPYGEEPQVLEITVGLVRSAKSDIHLIQGLVRDVTRARLLERTLSRAERLESMGRVAAGVAHEINNPLTWIVANVDEAADVLSADGDEGPAPPVDRKELVRLLREAGDGAHRIARIVGELRAVGRPEGAATVETDVGEAVRQARELARGETHGRARIPIDCAPNLRVLLPEGRLLQVLLNLVVNAAKSIAPGNQGAQEIRVSATGADRQVRIEVSDTGCGIPPENLELLFEPFFTTRASGDGSGLGLWICDRIVRGAGGRIEVASRPGSGTRFTVVLPAATGAARSGATEGAARDEGQSRGARLLVVDDEPLIRNLAVRVLQTRHETEAAGSAREALAWLERERRFDLILCDLVMSEMDGPDFWRELRRRRPALAARTVFMTGGAYSEEARHFLEEHHLPWLSKPFEGRELMGFVETMLARLGRDAERNVAPR